MAERLLPIIAGTIFAVKKMNTEKELKARVEPCILCTPKGQQDCLFRVLFYILNNLQRSKQYD